MRSWLFGILLSERAKPAGDPELLAAVLHDLGLTDRYTEEEERFEVDGANAARTFLKDRGISTRQTQVVWDAIARMTRDVPLRGIRLRLRGMICTSPISTAKLRGHI